MQSCLPQQPLNGKATGKEPRMQGEGVLDANEEEPPEPRLHSSSVAAAESHRTQSTHDPYYCLHKNIRMKKNHLGKGLYAIAPIAKGEVIYNAANSTTLARVDAKTMLTWPVKQFDFFEKFSWQVGHDLWSGPSCKRDLKNDCVNYINHSCDPTSWFDGEESLIARKDIQEGAEITFDYATSETAVSTFLLKGCLCGAANCRKRISPWDYRLPSLQEAYGPHFMPYLRHQIETEPELQLGTGTYFSLNKHVELRRSLFGGFRSSGLFATQLIPKGTIVWCGENDNDAVVTEEEFNTFSKDKKEWSLNFSYQVEWDSILTVRSLEDLDRDASHFMNHSCDPTLWFIGDKLLEARRDIQPGEELTYDYGTGDSLFERIKSCKCGSAECRGKVTTKDFLLPYMQDRYRHHFALYLLGELYSLQNKEANDMVEEHY